MLIFMVTLPLMFLSNSLYPIESLPAWMQIGARVNPVSYAVDGMRQTLFDSGSSFTELDFLPLWLCFLVVAVFAAVGTILAYGSFKKAVV